MSNFTILTRRLDVAFALAQLAERDDLWGSRPLRTGVGSPHAQSQDIWLRYRPFEELARPVDTFAPHTDVWYPEWGALTALHPLVFALAHRLSATAIGAVLLTRIPAGAAILPHVDKGWHPSVMDTKAYAILAANPQCVNYCGGQEVVMAPGEAWLFRNDIVHSVENHGTTDRIALIATFRTH